MPRFEPHPVRRPALVSGASSGIGAATAKALAAAGHPVALGARRVDRCEALVAEIIADGGEAFALPLDVTVPESVSAFVAEATAELGEVEILVSGAGDLGPGRLAELGPGEFELQIQVHLVGANRLAAAVLPHMIERRRGDIVFIGSDVGLVPRPHLGAYGAAKAGLNTMVKTLQMELEGSGVRAGLLHPGPTQTSMGMSWDPDKTGSLLEDWVTWGHARHSYFMKPEQLALSVMSMVTMPRGAQISWMEMQPEAPLKGR